MAKTNVNPVFHGLGMKFDNGSIPSVALNRFGMVLEVHKNEAGRKLYHRIGSMNRGTIDWGPSRFYDNGNQPQVALNSNEIAVEVHKNQHGHTLYHRVGPVNHDKVDWGQSLRYDSGVTPSVGLNDDGVVVEVHQSESTMKLWYNLGQVEGKAVRWHGKGHYDSGKTPNVALNNAGVVVEVHQSQVAMRLWYRVGQVNGSKIDFGKSMQFGSGGMNPSVALTADGIVIVTYQGVLPFLFRRVGKVNGKSIDWSGEPILYDEGTLPSVAAASTAVSATAFTAAQGSAMSVEVHQGALLPTLWASTSLHTNRASWMQDRLDTLGNRRLGWLVLAASHDAAMYPGWTRVTSVPLKPPHLAIPLPVFGKTQSLSLYEQLTAGVRYFDLRPKWIGRKFVISHGPVIGPDLAEVLKDIRDFAKQGYRELVILKLSHFDNIDNTRYQKLIGQISTSLGEWLVKSKPAGKRLADVTLGEYVANGPAFLIVVDGNYAIDVREPGFWVYRDWQSGTPAAGDLTVFDQYSKTVSFERMKNDQLKKFANFDGRMQHDRSIPCDLFLLSWTLTPDTAVWFAATAANRRLGEYMRRTSIPNQHHRMINLLYVDYVEFARVTDVAILQNPAVFTIRSPIATPRPMRPGGPQRVVVPRPPRR